MPQPHLRTRSRKRGKVPFPGGVNRTHYKRELALMPSCSICGQLLAGIPHLTRAEMGKLNRSKRKIWRPYGGQLCHNCLKKTLKQNARAL